jgi:hypothetical protein
MSKELSSEKRYSRNPDAFKKKLTQEIYLTQTS